MRYERLSLVPLSRAVGIDVVDVRKVRLELLVRENDDIVNIEKPLPPRLEIRRVDDELALAESIWSYCGRGCWHCNLMASIMYTVLLSTL
jgi:hypothetical protein